MGCDSFQTKVVPAPVAAAGPRAPSVRETRVPLPTAVNPAGTESEVTTVALSRRSSLHGHQDRALQGSLTVTITGSPAAVSWRTKPRMASGWG